MANKLPNTSTSTNIDDPSTFLDDTVLSTFETAIFRMPNQSLPTLKLAPNTMVNNLVQTEQEKFYQPLEGTGLARVSANGSKNGCWFDAFLTAVSTKYKSLSLKNRSDIETMFRKWCAAEPHVNAIHKAAPNFLKKAGLCPALDAFKASLGADKQEIDELDGYLIAWYFGVNLVYLKHDDASKQIKIVCNTSYQSPDCSCIFLYHTGNHFEPCTVVADGQAEKGLEYLFQWDDRILCQLQTLSKQCTNDLFDTSWVKPNCTDSNVGQQRVLTTKALKASQSVPSSVRKAPVVPPMRTASPPPPPPKKGSPPLNAKDAAAAALAAVQTPKPTKKNTKKVAAKQKTLSAKDAATAALAAVKTPKPNNKNTKKKTFKRLSAKNAATAALDAVQKPKTRRRTRRNR